MEAEGKLQLVDIFVGLRDPRQAKKVDHNLAELLVVAVSAVLAGADDFVEIEEWAKEKQDWFRQYLTLENGIPSHDTFGLGLFDVCPARDAGAGCASVCGQTLNKPPGTKPRDAARRFG